MELEISVLVVILPDCVIVIVPPIVKVPPVGAVAAVVGYDAKANL